MDRHYQGQQYHHHGNQQHQGSNNSPYPWSGNNSMPSYGGQAPPSSSPSVNPQNRIPNGGNMYYNQAQVNHNNTSSYGGASNQPYSSNQHAYSQHSANCAPPQYGVNPWGQYNQGQPYNTTAQPPPPPNTSVPVQAPGQSYNQYMYPPPAAPNQTNHNQGQNSMSYSQPVHSYYQMHQPSTNYYYSPPNQMYPSAVPPPPLPQDPPPPPPRESKKDTLTCATANDNSGESLSSSKRSEERPSKSSPPNAEKTAKSSKDKKPAQHTVDEKEEKETKKAVPIMVGKRRGGRVLPTGVVKKQKVEDDNSKGKSDAWSQYMAEVRRYKDQSCTEERQNRPLVK